MKSIWTALVALFLAGSLAAQEYLPDRRLVFSEDVDFYGADLSPIFDTTRQICEAACLGDPSCKALTFNAEKGACFPKSGIERRETYVGAISAEIVEPTTEALELAARRADEIGFLSDADFSRAVDLARVLGVRHTGGNWSPDVLLETSREREANGNISGARYWLAAALAQLDRSDLWLELARLNRALAAAEKSNGRKRQWQNEALSATVNAYLRSGAGGEQVSALADMAAALASTERGRLTVPALRLAQSIQPRADVEQALNRAIGLHGFRVSETIVESDTSEPRICVAFNEPLDPRIDYGPFVRLNGRDAVAVAEDTRLCLTGLTHGTRYQIALREGLPAESGEALIRDVALAQYVRDRSPSVRFPGRAYVLPKGRDAGLPIITVNADAVDLTLRRVDDRNVLRAVQDDLFGRAIGRYDQGYLDGTLGEAVWSGTAETASDLNADVTTRLPLTDVIAMQPPGLFALTASVPGEEADRLATQWFILSNIGLTSLSGSGGLTVLVNALQDTAPMAGTKLSLLSVSNRILATTTTDQGGMASFASGLLRGTGGAAPAMVLAEAGDDVSFLLLTDPAFDLSDRGVEGRGAPGPVDVFLTTERGAYRPGETIHATALVRDAKAKALSDLPLTLVLSRPDGVEAWRWRSDTGAAGGHSFAAPLPPTAPRGTWRLAAFADPNAPALKETRVLVEDFVPERIDVALNLSEGPLNPAALPRLGVQVDYLFGAPGADLAVETQMRLRQADGIERWPGYIFGRHDARFDPQTRYLDPTRTDASGAASLTLEIPDLATEGIPLEAELIVSAFEGSARPVERRLTRPIISPTPLLGIKPGFDGVAPEASTVTFNAIAFENGVLRELDATWELNRLRTRYDWYELYGRWNWEPTVIRERVASGSITTGAEPAEIIADVDWGEYELVLRTAEGTYAESAYSFWAGWYAPADASETPDTLDVALDRENYAPGDTAELLIDARYAGRARIAVLSDGVISMQSVEVPEGESRHILPVTEAWGQGAYVTVQLLRGAEGEDFLPGRALGLAHAAIDPGARALTVEITAPETSKPQTKLRPTIKVSGLPEGTRAHVRLAAVDLGILNLTAHPEPDLTGHYFGKRRLGVEMRDLYGRLIDGSTGQMGRLRQGGDATAGLSSQAPPPTEDLMAWVSAIVETDTNGEATLEIALPQFNGTLHLAAMAWTGDGLGQAVDEVIVRDPVVMSANLPRFLAPGDSSRLALDLTHVEGPAGPMPLAITAPGLFNAYSTEVSLTEGAQQRIDVPFAGGAPGDYEVTAQLILPNRQTLTRSWTIGVRRNDPPISRTQKLTLAPGETLRLDDNVFAGFEPDGAEVLLSAGPAARFDMPRLLSDLQRYPYACTEQVTSRALPLLYLSGMSDGLGLTQADEVGKSIAASIEQVLSRQSSSGGFGLWRAGAGDFWLDAYVTDFLSRARAAGHAVPERAFASALDNLSNRVSAAPDFEEGGEDIAYDLFVLAREGRAALNDLRYFADVKGNVFGTPLSVAQLGAALALYGDTTRSDRLFRRASMRITGGSDEATGWRDDYGTRLRDVAGVLALGAGSNEIDRAALSRRLAAAGGWLSTQEQAWILLAAHEARAAVGAASVSLDGVELSDTQAARFTVADAPREIANTGTAPLPLTLSTIGVPQGATEPGGQGYRLTRTYYTVDGAPHTGAFRVGERYVTVIDVTPLREVGARLMVNDPLPAGLEIDNPNLLRTGDISSLPWLKPIRAEHAEFRADRFLAAVDHRGSDRFALAYIVRAVSPGNFHHPAALVEDMYRPTDRGQTGSARITIVE